MYEGFLCDTITAFFALSMPTQITNIVSNSDYEGFIRYLVFAPNPNNTTDTSFGTFTVTNATSTGLTKAYPLKGKFYNISYGAYDIKVDDLTGVDQSIYEITGSPASPQTRDGVVSAILDADTDPFVANYKHFSNGYYLDGNADPAHNIPQGLGVTYRCVNNNIVANFFSEPPAPQHTDQVVVGNMLLRNVTQNINYGEPTNVYYNNYNYDLGFGSTYCAVWQNITLPEGSYTFRVSEDPTINPSNIKTTDISFSLQCCDNQDTSAPVLSSSSVTASCPTNTFNIDSITASNANGRVLEFHTVANPVSSSTLRAGAVSAGTYYGVFYIAGCAGYSNSSTIVVLSGDCATTTARQDWNSTLKNTAVTGNVATNDTACTSGATTYTVFSPPTNGTLVLQTSGAYTYTPNNNFVGTDRATINLRCDGNVVDSSYLEISVTQTQVTDDSADILVNQTASGDLSLNDAPCGTGIVKSYEVVTTTTNGSLTLATDGKWSYIPDENFVGTDTAIIRAYCGGAFIGDQTLTINMITIAEPIIENFDVCTKDCVYLRKMTGTATVDGDVLIYKSPVSVCCEPVAVGIASGGVFEAFGDFKSGTEYVATLITFDGSTGTATIDNNVSCDTSCVLSGIYNGTANISSGYVRILAYPTTSTSDVSVAVGLIKNGAWEVFSENLEEATKYVVYAININLNP